MEQTTVVKLSPELRKKLDAAVRDSPPPRKYWTPEEDAIVREYGNKLRVAELMKFLPGRGAQVVSTRKSVLLRGKPQ